MGWTVYYTLKRDRPLDAAERALLEDHNKRHGDREWEREGYHAAPVDEGGVIARGFTKPPDETDHEDWSALLTAVTELRGLIEGATCEVGDDFECVYWDDGEEAYSNGDSWGRPRR
jgi:hypothetical protein